MTEDTKIAYMRTMVGDKDADSVLELYLEVAKSAILNRAYPFAASDEYESLEWPVRYDTLQCEIAAYLMNKRGAEGQTQHSEMGVLRSYESAGIPASMLRSVVPYCGVIA